MGGPILFLDLASTTGWCEGEAGQQPRSGSIKLAPSGSPDPVVFGGLHRFLVDRLTERRYRMVVYEAPVGPGMDRAGLTNYATKRRLIGLCAVTEAVCQQTNHQVYEASVQAIRKLVLGVGRPKNPKPYVIAAMRREGHEPRDDNEADAICGWLYSCAMADRLNPPLLPIE